MILPPSGLPTQGPYRSPARRSLADMANEQLRRDNKPKEGLPEGMERAGRDDCLHAPGRDSAVGGLLAAPQLAARALKGECAK